MSKVTYFGMVSLDGYIERPDGSLDWVIVDEELHTFINRRQAELGAYLYGRRMYELMADAWPRVAADPSAPAFMAEFARMWQAMPKYVFSRTLKRVEWNATLVRTDAVSEIERLKAREGKDLEVGGADLAAALLRHGLIDEFELYVNPVVLGTGTRLFGDPSIALKLQLLETRSFRSGVVMLRYGRVDK